MNIKTTLTAATLTIGAIGTIGYGLSALPNGDATSCNNGVMTACEALIDGDKFYSGSADLNEAGQKSVDQIIADRLDTSRRAGENLKSGFSRIINSADVVSEDLKFTTIVSPSNDSLTVAVRWTDGVAIRYFLQADGTGRFVQDGVDLDWTEEQLNWEKNGNNIKITLATGSVTFLGGVTERVEAGLVRVADMRRGEFEAESARIAADRQAQLDNQDAIIRGIEAFRPFGF